MATKKQPTHIGIDGTEAPIVTPDGTNHLQVWANMEADRARANLRAIVARLRSFADDAERQAAVDGSKITLNSSLLASLAVEVERQTRILTTLAEAVSFTK